VNVDWVRELSAIFLTFRGPVPCAALLVLSSKLLRSRPSVPVDSRVTFFPKPKKVTKERFALRLALLFRGGRCVDELLLLGNNFRLCFVFAAVWLWFACFSAGLLQEWATSSQTKPRLFNAEGTRPVSLVFDVISIVHHSQIYPSFTLTTLGRADRIRRFKPIEPESG
jgi:hypothetical protein